jgi:hypothetical protein
MRTTLNLDDDVLAAVKSLASARSTSAGKVASELIRKGLFPEDTNPKRRYRNGVPLFTKLPGPGKAIVTSEMVKKLMEETE